jgi:integrase
MRGIILRNPMDSIRPPRAAAVRRTALTPEQCHDLLDAVNPEYRFAIQFALATGVRWSEFAGMTIRDFDPLHNIVRVTRSKTDAGIREIPLDPADTLMVTRHIAATGRTGADADAPLFTSPEGKPLHHSNFRRRVFAPACRKAGLDGVTFHDLRRTHATILVAAGFDAKVVQDRMGHRSISTTLNFYAAATRKGREGAAGALRGYLGSAEPHLLRDAG